MQARLRGGLTRSTAAQCHWAEPGTAVRARPCRAACPPRPLRRVCRAQRGRGTRADWTFLPSRSRRRASGSRRQTGWKRPPQSKCPAGCRTRTRPCVGAAKPARLRAEARAWFQGLVSELREALERRARLVPCTALGAALTVWCVVQAAKQPHDRDQDLCLSHQQD